MSKHSTLPMDSYRLARYTTPAACYVCGEDNNYDAELCRHCQAPMALAHQVKTQKVHPTMIGVIGSADAGKTVYLGMLSDMLSRGEDGLRMLARGAFSITLQQATMAALARGEFPPKTPNEPDRWNWVHCQVFAPRRKRPVELIMPDMAGEALMQEIEHPHTYPVIRAFLERCSGVLVLVDAARLAEGEKQQDFSTMKIVSYLCELQSNRRRGWPARPVGFVFTKADQCQGCFQDPESFAKKQTSGLWRLSEERLRRFRFFASGVAGACAYRGELGGRVLAPLRIEPHGIAEPFAWMVQQIGK